MTDVDEHEWLEERFEEHRTHLRAVAYRMLGSVHEADDAVQDAWLRVSRADTNSVENLAGWLTTVVARVCLNMLRSRQRLREEPLDSHVPDPIVSRETSDYIKGKYGRPPGEVNKELVKKIMKDKEPDYSQRSGAMADPADWDKAIKDLGPLAKNDEDLLLGVLFPLQAKEFLTQREAGVDH